MASAPQAATPAADPAGSELSRNLTILANNPVSVPALTGAGKAALDLDDPEAALTFFGRAEELSPQDGRIKAGIGSALVMMEQAPTALSFFAQAVSLRVPEAEFAGYRGLAFDLLGDPARAQRDYQLALRRREDPEVRRRLALSIAITGRREAALAMIDEQLRRQDRAAWRTRAFVLALTGDTQGATQAVQAAMPGQAAVMAPFLARLPSLSLADRALAVHFGHFPGVQGPVQTGMTGGAGSFAAASTTTAGRPDPRQPPLGGSVPAIADSVSTLPPRKPGTSAHSRQQVAVASAAPAAPATAAVTAAAVTAIPATNRPAPAASAEPGFSPSLAFPFTSATPARSASGDMDASASTFSLTPGDPFRPNTPPAASSDPSGASTIGGVASERLTTIASVVAGLSDPSPGRPGKPVGATASISPARTQAKPPSASSAKGSKAGAKIVADSAKKSESASSKNPSRSWVQIAHGATAASLTGAYDRIKGRAPKLFAGKNIWTASQRSTNRLLVGPFKSNKEAQAFADQLEKADVAALGWTSPAGQEIKKLPAK